jgi:tripartite-type tricarboxylate transporter receptor subunit TctC
MMIAPHIVRRADFDPIKVLTPAVATGSVSLYVMVKLDLPVKNYQEFLAYARANPGKLNYGTPGNGTSPHIAVEVYNREANVKLNHIPYKGAGPALKDLLGGIIDLTFDPGVGLGQAKAGKLRLIAIAGPQRHPDFPDVPTLEENGIKGVTGPYWVLRPTHAARDPDRLNREVQTLLKEPATAERFRALAVNVAPPMTPEAFAAYVRSEYARYGKLLKELGIEQ